jgi:hypothetical protein
MNFVLSHLTLPSSITKQAAFRKFSQCLLSLSHVHEKYPNEKMTGGCETVKLFHKYRSIHLYKLRDLRNFV